MIYSLHFTLDLDKACKKFPRKDKEAILEALKSLIVNPRPDGAIKLSGRDGFRLRVGNYRIIYKIEDERLIILVLDIDGRADIYKKK